jgi:hypothetical protein
MTIAFLFLLVKQKANKYINDSLFDRWQKMFRELMTIPKQHLLLEDYKYNNNLIDMKSIDNLDSKEELYVCK